ncbi:Asparagine synthetase [Candidatus Propionivibrio aalborgensis]|uniref:asparagine synthase (glutamine-hydrolyzing) n=2 Tax=Candidatus Propionivibrio aalborgensis TaxID=1860101 RepID=A0A1A8XX96_9RHOO|nr:asparagine synthase (glutamine-hydrolyzing) [Candidatus Propionivibrio aalborgensis]SBT09346.1 Asparagine synthetase [Candidatus Propionivibrio aalborgensis]
MCGIAGLFPSDRPGCVESLARHARAMADAIVHRGPDDSGIWEDALSGIALAHRRLSILDLSSAGHQPMHSSGGRYVLVFNGEIYNHMELRARLADRQSWRGHSDTETLLAAFEVWGIDTTLRSITGMFSLALWDRLEHRLVLARDRLGEKPLYYGWLAGTFAFGSELKTLCAFPGWQGEIDRDAAANYMRYGYVPLPHSIYRGIRKLIPGTFVTISAETAPGTWPEPAAYWSARSVANVSELADLTDAEGVDQLESLLRQSVGRQMISDVPLGAFLSGGIDSSTVVALMQALSAKPVKTFSIGFAEGDYDEAKHAKAVAAHLGTEHTELYVTPADALAVIPRLPHIFDEPFGDSSGIPTYLVAQLARRHVAVSLSGDGGDELFGGYNRYSWGRSIWRHIGPLPVGLRRMIGRALTALPPEAWDGLAAPLRAVLGRHMRLPALGDKIHKLAGVIDVDSPAELYRRLVSQHRDSGSLIIGGGETAIWADAEAARCTRTDFSEQMMFHDIVGYLTDDILTKVDRAAMAVSLETRVPMLDHELIEFAWRLPLAMKIRDGQGKWLLRQVLYRYVPRSLMDRPKQGFGIPLDAWLRGPLREWAESLLAESRLRKEGFLQPELVRRKWQEHLSGRRNWQHWLWNVLMFQAWHEDVFR